MISENSNTSLERIKTLKELIFEDISFSSDMIFGISGQRVSKSKESNTEHRHNRSTLLKNLIDDFAMDGADIKTIVDTQDLKDWQIELLSESIKDIISMDVDNSLSQEQKFSLLLSRPESKEMMANDVFDIHLSRENQLLLEKTPQVMNSNIAIAVLNEIHRNPDNFFGKGLYGKDADEVSENLCKFIFNKGSLIGEEFAEMHSFQGWIEALERAGFDRHENKFKNGSSTTTIDFIESKLDLSTSKPSITYETYRATTHHDNISQQIHDMENLLGLRADIVLSRFGEFRKKRLKSKSARLEERFRNSKNSSFIPTEFKKQRELLESSINDGDVKKIVFRNKKGRPIIETIGNNGILKSRGVQLCTENQNKPLDKETAKLMVLQFTKMNPDKKKIVINPPKTKDKDLAKKFIEEIICQAMELGYTDDAIKVTCGKGCPLTASETQQIRQATIEKFKMTDLGSSLSCDEIASSKINHDVLNAPSDIDEQVVRTHKMRPL
ncbi:hypothetical protein [Photobacterium damselae]|uniref:hypothetical protein n=1 Tax=Photobacterium damselae TaxID=38293 RepID=UPI001F47BA81|nr:hypothetical protein [Photobacterium damselae]UKA04668.1 hypothetical protein IHC89_23910 [Photobacterium damselae subsp. damselae]